MAFAEGTNVSEDRSRSEIEKLLTQYGASRFGFMTDYESRRAMIGFTFRSLQIRMEIPLPAQDDEAFRFTHKRRYTRSDADRLEAYRGEVRRRWRALVLSLKSKLVAVSEGITTFEKEFLPYMVTADGQTVGDKLMPTIEAAKAAGGVISPMLMLPAPEPEHAEA